jgi:hypothetical protein
MTSQGSDFADEIVQDKLPSHTEPPRDKFLPWHRVKKEFIRQFQWNNLTVRMIKRYWAQQLKQEETDWSIDENNAGDQKFKPPAGVQLKRPLQCLVIPGEDLLDVRALWRDMDGLNCGIRYLGFNESHGSDHKGTRVHVANNAVTSLPGVMKSSRVVPDRFESIASDTSQAYRYLKEYGPYHIVNLDLCGSMFPNTVKETTNYYDALLRLLVYQFQHQTSEWLLFITTMVEPAVVHVQGLQSLCAPTRENMAKYKEFADEIKKLLPEQTFQNTDGSLNLSALNEGQVVRLFGVALGKYLLALCHKAQPQWTVAMRASYCHTINKDKGAVMLSLAFALKPNITPPADATGMSKLTIPERKYPDERECAIKLAESVSRIRDVDELLAADQKLKISLCGAHADLLEAAGYDRGAYLKWVEDGEVVPLK